MSGGDFRSERSVHWNVEYLEELDRGFDFRVRHGDPALLCLLADQDFVDHLIEGLLSQLPHGALRPDLRALCGIPGPQDAFAAGSQLLCCQLHQSGADVVAACEIQERREKADLGKCLGQEIGAGLRDRAAGLCDRTDRSERSDRSDVLHPALGRAAIRSEQYLQSAT